MPFTQGPKRSDLPLRRLHKVAKEPLGAGIGRGVEETLEAEPGDLGSFAGGPCKLYALSVPVRAGR